MNYRILIAEDEPKLRQVICDYLESRGDLPIPAQNGEEALALAEQREFDGVLLDIMMPKLDGLSVCRALRRRSNVPIIFLTALSDEEDKLLGYELGADDYVTKPFSLAVLHAKLTALINRSRGSVLSGDRLTAGDIQLILSSQKVLVNGKEISLTPKEYALLLCLMRNKNMVLSREQLLVKCWGYDYEGKPGPWTPTSSGSGKSLGPPHPSSRPSSKQATNWRCDHEIQKRTPIRLPRHHPADHRPGPGPLAAGYGPADLGRGKGYVYPA